MKKIALLFTLLWLPSAFANSHRYQIEIILFQQRMTQAMTQEEWPAYPALPETDNAIEYPLLSSSNYVLNDEAARIRNSNQYRLLGHLAWQQPVNISRSTPTRIHLQNNFDNDLDFTVDGTLSLTRTNYIIVNANLVLSLPPSENDGANRQVILKQQHRMSTRELYYFDQPLFGMLIKVIPVG